MRLSNKEALDKFWERINNIGDYVSFNGKSTAIALDGWYLSQELRLIADALDEYFEDLEKEEEENGQAQD